MRSKLKIALHMLDAEEYTIRVRPVSREAAYLAADLGLDVCSGLATVTLNRGDRVVVGQDIGPRLPEGATTLPEGAQIAWYLVEVD